MIDDSGHPSSPLQERGRILVKDKTMSRINNKLHGNYLDAVGGKETSSMRKIL